MNGKELLQSLMARRRFLARLGLGAGVVGASVVSAPAGIAKAAGDASWQPAREAQDNWYDEIPGKHRFVFDTTTAQGFALALHFASNYIVANEKSYGLKSSDLAVLIIARHESTTFGYNDAMWAKYGKYFAGQAGYKDPKTNEAPKVNPYMTASPGPGGPTGIDTLVKQGVHFAVCAMSTGGISGRIAKETGSTADAVVKEIGENLVGNARFVPAGIVAVNRAQERGYSFVYAI
jgi:intracellular sulfur oxidation DsrE/DsrF family protein